MAIVYKKLFELLENKKISSYYLRQNKIIGQSSWTKLKKGEGSLGKETLDKFCKLLNCQPADIMEYIPDEEKTENEVV